MGLTTVYDYAWLLSLVSGWLFAGSGVWYGHLVCEVNAEYRERRKAARDRSRETRRCDPLEYERVLVQMNEDDRLPRYKRRSWWGYAIGMALLVAGVLISLVEQSAMIGLVVWSWMLGGGL
jgi:hypothetical protein